MYYDHSESKSTDADGNQLKLQGQPHPFLMGHCGLEEHVADTGPIYMYTGVFSTHGSLIRHNHIFAQFTCALLL